MRVPDLDDVELGRLGRRGQDGQVEDDCDSIYVGRTIQDV